MNKIVLIMQTRMGSTRLPGKVMKKLKGKPVLWHDIQRIKQSKMIDEIVIATTTKKQDNIVHENALKWGVKSFRGSEEDVLKRYYGAAKEYKADIIVRVTSDCPLIDPNISDEVIEFYLKTNYNLVTNAGIYKEKRTFPRGFDTEVFSFKVLEEAFEKATEKFQREHVTPYIYEHYNNDLGFYKSDSDYSDLRLTLDTREDLKLIRKIYEELYKGEHNFYFEEILSLFKNNPKLQEINKNIKQKNLKV